MSKELEAYDIVFNSFNNCTCQDGKFPIRSALDTIYQALKRNEPMKPIKYEFGGFQCPACGGLHCQSYNSDLSERNLNFCDDCGKALDWSDEK